MQQMSGGQPPSGAKESFSVFFSKVAGITTLICFVLLMTDSPPSLQKHALMILKYAVGSWGVFVALPYIVRSILKAPWQIATHLKSILRGVAIVIGLPFVLRTLWKNRHNLKGMIPRLINKWLESIGLGGLIVNVSPSVAPDLNNLQPGIDQAGRQSQSSPLSVAMQSSLPAPYDRLPINPNPIPSSTLDPTMASNLIRSAIEQAGINLDQNIDVISVESGPTLQTISFRLPPNLQFSQLRKKHEDLATHLGFRSGFSITSSHHRSAAAFVVPHKDRAAVYMRDIAAAFIEFAKSASIPMIFGKDALGRAVFMDLVKLPHLLIAGSTGSGKSVFLNGLLASALQSRSPSQLQFLLIDPKMVELNVFNGFPHLLSPVVTDPKRASLALKKVVVEMEKRYERMGKVGARNIIQYNRQSQQKMPYIVVVIDEYADLMMVAAGDVEDAVQRITQMGRAAGIHLISATQRPSSDIVTGTIKANLPSRVSFRLQGRVNYQVVLDSTDPNLLGMGDGVFTVNGGNLERFQSAAISINDDEAVAYIEDLKSYWRENSRQGSTSSTSTLSLSKDSPSEDENAVPADKQLNDVALLDETGQMSFGFPGLDEEDHEEEAVRDEEIYQKAVEWAQNPEVVFSASLLQRRFRIGALRAARIVDRMEQEGLIGPYDGQNPGRKWLGGQSEISATPADSPPWHDNEALSGDDEYTHFYQLVKDKGGFSMSFVQERMQIDSATATMHLRRMMEEGLIGSFDARIGMRPYIDPEQSDQAESELLDRIKEYVCSTGSVNTNELREMFQMRKEEILSLCKKLVDEGFLNDYTSKREGYTIAWSPEQMQEFLLEIKGQEKDI